MQKNVAGQKIGAQLVSATDGSAFTGVVTVYYTGDAGTQTIGSDTSGGGVGACVHKGNGYHTYSPTQGETNFNHIGWTFIGTGAVPVTVQVYPDALVSSRAVAGDEMDLVDAPNLTAVGAIQSGLATPTNITAGTITTVTNLTNAPTSGDFTAAMKSSITASVPSASAISTQVASDLATAHGAGSWATATGFALAEHWTEARAGYIDKLNVTGTLAHSDAADTYKADVSGLSTFDPAEDAVNVGSILGTALSEGTAGQVAAGLSFFFDVETPTQTMEDVGGEGASVHAITVVVASAIGAGEVLSNPITLYQYESKTFTFALVDQDGNSINEDGDSFVLVVYHLDGVTELFRETGTASTNQVTITVSDDNTATAGDYYYRLWNTTEDAVRAQNSLTIKPGVDSAEQA